MKNILKRAGVLLGIFILAVAVYFIWEQKHSGDKVAELVYTSMEEATLPVAYPQMYGKDMNSLRGYRQEMGADIDRGALTVLPEDRKLNLSIDEYGTHIVGIRYEIRSLDLSRLVERTTVENWDSANERVTVALPIQNLLIEGQEYLLDLCVETQEHGPLHYYTRIIWRPDQDAQVMIDFAVNFMTRTFDYNQARELVTYLETNNTEDNSSLGQVTIRSSFAQITWAGLKVTPLGPPAITLKELDGIMSEVQLEYLVTREEEEGGKEYYEVTDHYTMKWSSQRIYLMEYTRRTNQIFTGSSDLFSGKRITLGIANEEVLRTKKSKSGKQIAFVFNRDLWCYDQTNNEAVKIFSFRSGKDDGVRSDYKEHNVKILGVEDNGNVDFIVYGYMNRGAHEGRVGVALYHFDSAQDTVEEKFFAPSSAPFERLESDVEKLTYLGANGMFYLLIDHAVYGIDLNSNEYLVVADALREGSYSVSEDGKRFAWQEGAELFDAQVIHIMDFDTSKKQDVMAENGCRVRTLGFVGSDFIYGLSREGDRWEENGRVVAQPMYALEILGDDMKVETRYEKPGLYISSVAVQGSRIHLNRIALQEGRQYMLAGEDTLVCNLEVKEPELEGIGWYASSERRKVYFIQLDQEVKSGQGVLVSAPGKIFGDTKNDLDLKANTTVETPVYYAYGGGEFLGLTENFAKAVELAHPQMGLVVDENQRIIWNRVNRGPNRQLKTPQALAEKLINQIRENQDGRSAEKSKEEGVIALDARGCTLSQMLYFIDHGCPVVAFVGEGQYRLIVGYDQYNVTLMDPGTGETGKMGQNDANEYFKNLKNDFICGILTN